MTSLIWTDSHIAKENISELEEVFSEIMSYKANRVICIGDYFDRKILNSEELIFGTSIMKQFVDKYEEVYLLEGNHDKNTVKYLLSLGVKVSESLELDNNYYGHFFVEESIKSFNSAKRKLNDFDKYNKVFLGHQHSFQVLGKNRLHIGSPLWVDFGEVEDTKKCIALLKDDNINIVELKSPIPMVDVFRLNHLDKLNSRTKVRYVIRNFKQLKEESNKLEEYKNKFYQFKVKLDFETEKNDIEISSKKSIEEIVNTWLESIKDVEVKKELKAVFTENR
jgi:DNA repair exonuclease SbcCD nuclease subunit